MFSRKPADGYGLLIDIGSGSVAMAICDTRNAEEPLIIWSHREHTPLKVTESVDESCKTIATTLMNSMLLFETNGRPALQSHDPSGSISSIQATVSAPWSYTVTRTINFKKDTAFTVTEDLLKELAAAAGTKALEEFSKIQSLEKLGVIETSRTVLDAYANGYRLTTVNEQKATELNVTHVSTLVRQEIIDALNEMREKLFASTPLHTTSYMLANYYVIDAMPPEGEDFCLVDVTNEATELAVIRNNTLQYSTHVAYGRASLAREYAHSTDLPLHEAFTSLRTLDHNKIAGTDFAKALEVYIQHITELFKETGDRLTIPRYIYLQTDVGMHEFFKPLIEKAGKEASRSNVSVILIEPGQLQKQENLAISNDTALSVAMRFFHTQSDRTYFEYL